LSAEQTNGALKSGYGYKKARNSGKLAQNANTKTRSCSGDFPWKWKERKMIYSCDWPHDVTAINYAKKPAADKVVANQQKYHFRNV